MNTTTLAEAIALLKKDFAELGQVHISNMKYVWDLIEGYENLLVGSSKSAEPVIAVDTKGTAIPPTKATAQ